MLLLPISFLAGLLTILAPCVLPMLPIIIGSAATSDTNSKTTNKAASITAPHHYISKRALRVILALSVSVIVFTILLKATTALIAVPASFWALASGTIISFVGLTLVFPNFWQKIPGVQALSNQSGKNLSTASQQKSLFSDFLVGFALGPVFTTCSPTYFFILATVLPISFMAGLIHLLLFTLGMAISLALIAYFGQQATRTISTNAHTAETIKKWLGLLIFATGLLVATGYDKKIETAILDSGYGATINFEESLLDWVRENEMSLRAQPQQTQNENSEIEIPAKLLADFPNTNWNLVHPSVKNIIHGGVGKDDIPAINAPVFEPINNATQPDSAQAVVLKDGQTTKVYPYNILVWHEIVNDIVEGDPITVSFCPLCGSAMVYNGTLDEEQLSTLQTDKSELANELEPLTFGVSGSLFESNKIMYDHQTESLWQQSTGRAIAGDLLGTELSLHQFQLLPMGTIRKKYPNALILSEDTGYDRDYKRNPYSGYDESEQFIFQPTQINTTFAPKTLMLAFRIGDTSIALPASTLQETTEMKDQIPVSIGEENGLATIRIAKENGKIFVYSSGQGNGTETQIPYYYEMWFSWAVQNHDNGVLFGDFS